MALGAVVLSVSDTEKAALAKQYTDMFPQGVHAHFMYGYQFAALAAKDEVAARARKAIASLLGTRFAEGRAYLFERYVLPYAIEQGEAAVDKLAGEVLASNETSPQLFLALGRAYKAETADQKLALRLLTRGYENWTLGGTPRAGDELRLEIGRAHLRLGDAARAAEFLGAVKSDDLSAEVAFDLGRVFMKLGDVAKAFDTFARAVAADPSPERVRALSEAARAANRTEAEADASVWAIRDGAAKPAPPFTFAALDGKQQVSLTDYRGKVVLLAFWFPG
jgi:tetratricopeptide (TPR) repeat protein